MAALGRVAYFGTGAFAVPLLQTIAPLTDELLVVTRPDRAAGRGLRVRAGPVAEWARAHGIPVATPERLRSDEDRAAIREFAPDGILLAAYGQLVPGELLATGVRPPLNVHPSLLPRHRGAAPIPAAILAGDVETGVTLMVMSEKLDAGPVVARWRVPLRGEETTPDLESRLALLAADAVPSVLRDWAVGSLRTEPQDETLATYSRTFRREDGAIDWAEEMTAIDRQVRALQPWPGAWTIGAGRRLHVRRGRGLPDVPAPGPPGTLTWSGGSVVVACGADGAYELLVVQPEGRAPMPAADWLRGIRDPATHGVRLGAPIDEA